MGNREIKTLWKVAKRFWISATIFWIIETVIFLIYEGWHLHATNPIEKYCDKVVSGMWDFALWLTILICMYCLMNLNKKK